MSDGGSDSRALAARLERLRALRVRKERDTGVRGQMLAGARMLERQQRRLAGVAEAWASACPAALVDRTAIVGLTGGVLTVSVTDAAAKFELDRALRTGVEAEVIRRCSAPVRKVKLVAGE